MSCLTMRVLHGLGGIIAVTAAFGQTAIPNEQATLKRYCAGCHNAKVKTAGLALDSLDVHNVAQATDAWEKVVRKLRTRSMPPAGLPRPDEQTYQATLSLLESSLDAAS